MIAVPALASARGRRFVMRTLTILLIALALAGRAGAQRRAPIVPSPKLESR
jgi:hypothetical protein